MSLRTYGVADRQVVTGFADTPMPVKVPEVH